MFGDPIIVIGEVYNESLEYTCSNSLCSNYGVIIEQEATWKKRYTQWKAGWQKKVKDFALTFHAKIDVLLRGILVLFKRY